MTTATSNFSSHTHASPIAAPTLLSLVTALFGLNLRESLNGESRVDQSEAAYHYGM